MTDPRAARPAPALAPSRRDVLRYLAYGSAGAFALPVLAGCTSDTNDTTTPQGPAAGSLPLLVVIELGGGNDGLSMLAPFEDGRYHDLRPSLALGGDAVIDQGDGWGLNAGLAQVATHRPAFVAGVGSLRPSLSHFDMLDRWWEGRADPRNTGDNASMGSGFLGRLCDQLQGDESFTGISLSFGNPPTLRATKAGTTGLPTAQPSQLTGDPTMGAALQDAFRQFTRGSGAGTEAARHGLGQMLLMDELITALPSTPEDYPDSDFGVRLAIASRLLRSDAGVRVIHVPMGGGNFDTHQDHGEIYPELIAELDAGLGAFLADLAANGLDRRVLVATTSEFGRRPKEHDGGLDHGTASTMLLTGPVNPGHHGEPSPLDRFDDTDNFVTTLAFHRYLSTLATWMQVDPAAVITATDGDATRPIEGVLAT